MDTDNLLDLVRASLRAARLEAPGSPAVKRAADAFEKLDAELQRPEALLPEDWEGDENDDGDDDDAGAPDDDEPDDDVTDADAEEEMRRVTGGG